MEITRKTNIVVKTARRFIIKHEVGNETILCERCGEPMIAAQAAAQLFVVSSRMIYRLVERGAAHFVEAERSELYVCPSSVKAALETQETNQIL